MSKQHIIRNYRPEDFDHYARLNTEAQELGPAGDYMSPDNLRKYLQRPNYTPEQDLFLAETAGDIAGYLDITPELGISRVIVSCFVSLEHRRQGLATELLEYALKRVRELGVKAVHANIAQENRTAAIVLDRLA